MTEDDVRRIVRDVERECRALSGALSAAVEDFNQERSARIKLEEEAASLRKALFATIDRFNRERDARMSLERRIEALEGRGQRLEPQPVSMAEQEASVRRAAELVRVPPAPLSPRLTSDRTDPRLGHGADDSPRPMNEAHLVLSVEERAKGYLRPVRDSYRHEVCGTTTMMAVAIAETYARDPWHYGSTRCVTCHMYRPLREFRWLGGGGEVQEVMDPAEWPPEILEAVVQRRKELEGEVTP